MTPAAKPQLKMTVGAVILISWRLWTIAFELIAFASFCTREAQDVRDVSAALRTAAVQPSAP